jgi:DNA-binding NtrC family response regulator
MGLQSPARQRRRRGAIWLTHLSQLPWPGNVRQLQSVLKVMLALADEGDTLTQVAPQGGDKGFQRWPLAQRRQRQGILPQAPQ